MALVRDNNIFYRQSMDHKLEKMTTTGEVGSVYHGVTDWLYRGIPEYISGMSPAPLAG